MQTRADTAGDQRGSGARACVVLARNAREVEVEAWGQRTARDLPDLRHISFFSSFFLFFFSFLSEGGISTPTPQRHSFDVILLLRLD